MTSRARKVLLTIGIVLGLILFVLASLSLVVQIPSIQAQIRSRIESELQAQLDRDLQIGEIHLSPFLSLDVRNIRIARGERLEDGVLAEVERLELYPNLVDLLRFRLGISRIVLRSPTVTLDLLRPESAPTAPPASAAPLTPIVLPLGIEHVQIRDGSVGVKATGAQVNLDGLHVDVRAPEGAIAATLRIEQGKIQAGTTPLSVKDLVLRAGIDGDDINVKELRLTAVGADVQVQGRVLSFQSDPALDLTLKARSELAGLFPKGPPIPLRGAFTLDGKATGPLADPSFKGQANISGGHIEQVAVTKMTVALEADRRQLRLEQLTLKTASGDLTGDVKVTWDTLRYRLALSGEKVDLADILRVVTGDAPVGGQATVQVQATGEGADLTKAKGQANIRVEEFHLSDHPKDRGRVQIALEGRDGRVHVRQGEVALAGTLLRTKGVVKLGGDVDLDVDMRFSKLEDFGRLLGADPGDVDGQASITGHLTGPLSDPVLRGTLDWTEGILLKVALDRVRGPIEVAFARRTLTSPSLTVLRKNLRGDLDLNLLLGPKPPDRKILLKYDLTLDIDSEVKGPFEQLLGIFAKGATFTSGSMHLKAQVQGTPETLRGKGALALTEATILEEPWERADATVDLRVQQKRVFLSGIELRRRDERIAGRFEIHFDGIAQWNLTSNALAIERLAVLKDSGLTGTAVVSSLKGEGLVAKPRVTAELEVEELAYREVSLGRGHGTVTWDGSQDRLTGLMAIPERGYQLQAELTTRAPHPYSATLALDKGDLVSLLGIVRGPIPAHIRAAGSGKIDVAGRLGEKTPERATVNLETARLDIQNKEKHSFRIQGPTHFTFQGGQLTISPFSIRGEGADVAVDGTIGEEMDVAIQGTAPLVLATVLSPEIRDATGMLELDVKVQGPERLPTYRGHARTKNSSLTLRVHPEPVKDLQGEIRLSETSVETNGLQARWGGGKVNAKLQGKLEQPGWRWQSQFTLDDARAERIFVMTEGGETKPLGTGPLRANGAITAGGRPEFLTTLGGQLRIEMGAGVIHRSFSLEKALELINLRGLFKKGPKGKGMPYDEISGTFNLKDGIARTEDLKLRSPAVRVSGVGQLDLPNLTVDEHLAIQPLQLTDSLLKVIGNAPIIKQLGIGTLLFGKKRSIMVISYRVHGPLTAPEVTRVPTKAVDQGVLGIFEKTLELPGQILSGSEKESSEENRASDPKSSN